MTEHRGLMARLMAPVDIAWLAAFRMLYGLLMFAGITRFVLSGWVEVLYVEPQLHFKYPGFEWVTSWPGWGMYVHFGALAMLALMVALGLFHRVAAPLFTLGFAYVQLIDVTNYLNHYYLAVLLGALLSVMPAHRAWSLDAVRAPRLRQEAVPAWMLLLLRFQIAVVYLYAGLAKVGGDWLLHAQPLNLWLAARTEAALFGPLLAQRWTPHLMSWAGFLFDTTIVLWLSLARTRPFAYAVLLCFHIATGMLFDIGLFPFIMTVAALLFFPPDWPRSLLRLAPATLPRCLPLGGRLSRSIGLAAVAGYCVLQVLVPLRHYAYPGNVLWNEDGMRFSWKVMVREKHGSVTYRVRDRVSGRQLQVTPSEYLTPRQEGEMSSQPDLILQLAHHICDDFARRGGDVEVRAQALVSLNGRRAAQLVDPDVDLATLEVSFRPSWWVAAEPSSVPIQLSAARLPRR